MLSGTVTDRRIEKWTGWIDGTIRSNVFTMYLQRDAWQEVAKILKENSENLPDSYWWQFMFDTYSHTQVMAVRRQADTRRGSVSLGKLLGEVAGRPQQLTRTRGLAYASVTPTG